MTETVTSRAAIETNGNGGALSVLLGYGDGTFDVPKVIGLPGQPYSVVSGDFNRDGKQDLVLDTTVSDTASIMVLLGNGDGTFRTGQTYSGYYAPFLLAADFNGDHKLDIAAIGQTGFEILLGNGDGTFQPGDLERQRRLPIAGAIEGDFNRDGKPDIAVSSGSGVYIFLGNGDGTFQAPFYLLLPVRRDRPYRRRY